MRSFTHKGLFEVADAGDFAKGDKVQLGDGRVGKVVDKVEKEGFSGYHVEILESSDESQVGTMVAASPAGMRRTTQSFRRSFINEPLEIGEMVKVGGRIDGEVVKIEADLSGNLIYEILPIGGGMRLRRSINDIEHVAPQKWAGGATSSETQVHHLHGHVSPPYLRRSPLSKKSQSQEVMDEILQEFMEGRSYEEIAWDLDVPIEQIEEILGQEFTGGYEMFAMRHPKYAQLGESYEIYPQQPLGRDVAPDMADTRSSDEKILDVYLDWSSISDKPTISPEDWQEIANRAGVSVEQVKEVVNRELRARRAQASYELETDQGRLVLEKEMKLIRENLKQLPSGMLIEAQGKLNTPKAEANELTRYMGDAPVIQKYLDIVRNIETLQQDIDGELQRREREGKQAQGDDILADILFPEGVMGGQEQEVIDRLERGETDQQIADALGLNAGDIRSYRNQVFWADRYKEATKFVRKAQVREPTVYDSHALADFVASETGLNYDELYDFIRNVATYEMAAKWQQILDAADTVQDMTDFAEMVANEFRQSKGGSRRADTLNFKGITDTGQIISKEQTPSGMMYVELRDPDTGLVDSSMTAHTSAEVEEWMEWQGIERIEWDDGRVTVRASRRMVAMDAYGNPLGASGAVAQLKDAQAVPYYGMDLPVYEEQVKGFTDADILYALDDAKQARDAMEALVRENPGNPSYEQSALKYADQVNVLMTELNRRRVAKQAQEERYPPNRPRGFMGYGGPLREGDVVDVTVSDIGAWDRSAGGRAKMPLGSYTITKMSGIGQQGDAWHFEDSGGNTFVVGGEDLMRLHESIMKSAKRAQVDQKVTLYVEVGGSLEPYETTMANLDADLGQLESENIMVDSMAYLPDENREVELSELRGRAASNKAAKQHKNALFAKLASWKQGSMDKMSCFWQLNEIKDMPQPYLDMEIARIGMVAELDATSLYEWMAEMASDAQLKAVLMDVAREEKTHTGEFDAILSRLDPEQYEEDIAGAEEVGQIANEIGEGVNAPGEVIEARMITTDELRAMADKRHAAFWEVNPGDVLTISQGFDAYVQHYSIPEADPGELPEEKIQVPPDDYKVVYVGPQNNMELQPVGGDAIYWVNFEDLRQLSDQGAINFRKAKRQAQDLYLDDVEIGREYVIPAATEVMGAPGSWKALENDVRGRVVQIFGADATVLMDTEEEGQITVEISELRRASKQAQYDEPYPKSELVQDIEDTMFRERDDRKYEDFVMEFLDFVKQNPGLTQEELTERSGIKKGLVRSYIIDLKNRGLITLTHHDEEGYPHYASRKQAQVMGEGEDYGVKAYDRWMVTYPNGERNIYEVKNVEVQEGYSEPRVFYRIMDELGSVITEDPMAMPMGTFISSVSGQANPNHKWEKISSRQARSFEEWLMTYLDEANVGLEEMLVGDVQVGDVVQAAFMAPAHEQAQIKDTIVKIDFHAGDVRHFLRHLAQAPGLKEMVTKLHMGAKRQAQEESANLPPPITSMSSLPML